MDSSDNGMVILLVVLLLPIGLWSSFKAGQRYERKFWTRMLPDAFEKTCLECAGITSGVTK